MIASSFPAKRSHDPVAREVRRLAMLSAVSVPLALCAACDRPPKGRPVPSIDANAAGRAAIAQYDTDGDGKIDGTELDAAPSLKSSLAFIDTNHDGAISAEEVTACIQDWQEKRWGGRPLTCIVTHDKQPLRGADVKFVPEEFLGTWKPFPSIGHTGRDGAAAMGREVSRGSGPFVPVGFYRVEITKSGEKIPAKFNTKTTLGVGVIWNDPTFSPIVRLDLAY